MTGEKTALAHKALPDVFISYRRQEASYLAAWLHDSLTQRLGSERVFLDIDCIQPGSDFMRSIEMALRHSIVALIIIGSKWLTDDDGVRRIDAPQDPVRREIEIALGEGITVLPILLDDTRMPGTKDLPPTLRTLARFNSFKIRPDSARSDLLRLLAVVEGLISDSDHALPRGRVPEIEPQAGTPFRTIEINPDRRRKQRERLVLQLTNLYAERVNAIDQMGILLPLVLDLAPEKIFRNGDQFLASARLPRASAPARGVTELLHVLGEDLSDGILVLGSAGSGKTSSIFQIAQHLIREGRNHEDRPLPAYLHLSTWGSGRGRLGDWAVEQLHLLYQVPPPLGRHWIESGALLLLLDGLDEISDPMARSACAREINSFRRFGSQVSVPTIVACRTEEYDVLGVALNLGQAVVIRPLDPDVVFQQLAKAGPPARALTTRLVERPDQRDLLRSPLLVTMLLSTASALRQNAKELRYQQSTDLIGSYLQHRFELERQQTVARRNSYRQDLTLRWLSDLARNLGQSYSVFLPDRIPAAWLPSRLARRLVVLVVPTAWGAILGLTFAIALKLAADLGLGPSINPFVTIASFTSLGLVAGLIHARRLYLRSISWLMLGMAIAIFLEAINNGMGAISVLMNGLAYGLFFGLMGELAGALLGGRLDPVEHLSFSWTVARKTVPRLCLVGVVVGITYSLANWLPSGLPLSFAVLLGVVFGLMLGVVFGLALALRKGIQLTLIPVRVRPHEGLKRSVRYGGLIGLCSGVVVGASFFLSGLLVGPELGLIRGITWGPAAGSLLGLATGLGAVLQYWVLRLFLWQAGAAPLRYIRWLEYLVALRVLYRTGGGYVFMHRILQDWLAHESLSESKDGPQSS